MVPPHTVHLPSVDSLTLFSRCVWHRFRVLDVCDPDDLDAGPILRLEHELRSATTADGKRYKSCPLDETPEMATFGMG